MTKGEMTGLLRKSEKELFILLKFVLNHSSGENSQKMAEI